MERSIGEIFEYNGEWYQCVESQDGSCKHCDMNFEKCPIPIKECTESGRSDKSYVIFKKLERVGEPFSCNYYGDSRLVMMQEYQLFDSNVIYCYQTPPMYITDYKHNRIAIEIKQNKEDMEEYRMYDAKEDIPEFDKVVDECLFGEDKLNLKLFDFEAAKQGKPVCTRNGRKARIICFDAEGEHPIIALVTDGVQEYPYNYTKEGYYHTEGVETMADLMMLPEKKEGWVNVYREESNNNERLIEQTIYKTRKDAFDNACPKGYITTTKINWKE